MKGKVQRMKKNNKKGFTLAELLIVVAIIAVLVAIAIPVFTKRLEASRETADMANLRSAYAAAQVALLSNDPDDNIGKNMYFDPSSQIGLSASPSDSTRMGKGTTLDGGADVSSLPRVGDNAAEIYNNTVAAAGKSIKITFDAAGTQAAKITEMGFAD